jgi:predicted MFS family arabinose efflux permease
MLLLPALVPLVAARYGVSVTAVDAVGTAHYLAFGLGAIPAGILADRFGSRNLLLACLGGCAASAALVAAAPSFAVFSIGLVGLGAAASVYHPSGLSLISRATPPDALGRAIGVHGVGGNLGEAFAPAAAALLAAATDWRLPFVLAAAGSAMLLLPVASLPRMPSPTPSPSPNPAPDPAGSGKPWFAFPGLGLVLVSALLGGFVYRGATYFMPRHLTDHVAPEGLATLQRAADWLTEGRRGDALGAVLTSIALLAGVLAQWWGGRLADRFRRERLFVTLTVIVAPMLVLMATLRDTPLVAVALGFGFTWYLSQPLLNSIAATFVPRERHGALYGLLFSTSFGLGSFAVSAGSAVASRWGTGAAFLALSGVAALNILCASLLALRLRRRGTEGR